jgi:hypothetical protein
MDFVAAPSRLMLVAVLAVSTSTAPLCTPVAKGETRPPASTKHSCCCGTEDGACCGMACCMRQRSNQVPAAPLSGNSAGQEGPQAVILFLVSFGSVLAEGSGFGQPYHPNFCGSLATATLQSQHVRIQT